MIYFSLRSYRTSSPTGAAAQKGRMTKRNADKEKKETDCYRQRLRMIDNKYNERQRMRNRESGRQLETEKEIDRQ